MLLKVDLDSVVLKYGVSFFIFNKLPGYTDAANLGTIFLSNEN